MNQNLEPLVLSHAVNQCASAIVVTDITGTILYANPRFLALTGYTINEVIGANPCIMQSGETPRETYTAMWNALAAGGSWHGEVKNRRKDGSIYWSSLTVAAVKNETGEVVQYIGIQEDITEQKNLHRQLTNANAELVQSNEDLKRFTSVLSHDLKGPLSSMISGLSILEERLEEGDLQKEVGLKLTRSVHGLASRSLNLVTELVSYVRSGATGTRSEEVDVENLLEIIKENLGAFLHNKKAEVTTLNLPRIRSNRTLLTLIFQNLIENGVKYCTKPRPQVRVSAARDDSTWIFAVEDNGIGIGAGDQDKLFKPFVRLEVAQGVTGTGLGLATCKRIVDLFGGRIWIESQLGRGSTFKFTIPDPPAEG